MRPSLAEVRMFAKYHLRDKPAEGPVREEALGIVPLDFDFDAYVAGLRARADRFRVSTLAEPRHAGRAWPMLLLRSQVAAPRRLMVIAGIHGNEHAGLLAVPPILDASLPCRDVELIVIAPANPVGAAHLSRYNADGHDLNRDFRRFRTEEARAIRRVFEDTPPDFVVSLHEGPQDATFLFTNARVRDALAHRLLAALTRGGTRLADTDYFHRHLDRPGHAPATRAHRVLTYLWARALGMMATNRWTEEHGIPEITIESSWRLPDRDARVRPHVDLVRALLSELGSADGG